MVSERIPAEVWPLGEFIAEELEARGWTTADLAARMGQTTGRDLIKDQFCVEMTIAVHDLNLITDEKTLAGMSAAFGVDPNYLRNLDKAWREAEWRKQVARARAEKRES